MRDDTAIINEEAAYRLAQSISDTTVRNLVLLGIAKARMRFVRPEGREERVWLEGLPAAPFDLRFYASVLASVFEEQNVVRAVLDGKTLEDAAGWE